MSSVEKVIDDTTEYVADAAIGVKAATRGFQIRLDTSKACKVNVLTRGAGKPTPVFRLDAAHGGHPGASVPHINIGSKISGIRDPHLPIPGGQVGLQAGQTAAKVCKVVNTVLLPIAIAVDVYQGGKAIFQDVDKGTSRNTVETSARIAGGWGGGFGGAAGGAALGTAIFPGIGTIVGGIIGGISGGIGGSLGAEKLTEVISDNLDYDIEDGEKPCRRCKRRYKYRKYVRKDNGFCDECSSTQELPENSLVRCDSDETMHNNNLTN